MEPSCMRHGIDPDGLLEYSVVFSDRSLNHMSAKFIKTMQYILSTLKSVYKGQECILVPGGGSFGMEAVARQFCNGNKCMVLRNGWFSFRWTEIWDQCKLPSSHTVLKARRAVPGSTQPFAPCPLEEVVAAINAEKPEVFCAPHVETSAGMMLPNDYIKAVADAVHANGGIMVLDCVASGCIWIDMKALGVDVLVTAPQKGWSASPCSGIILLSELGAQRMQETTSSSFAANLKKWHGIMQAYEKGGAGYHATMPTDALVHFANIMKETEEYGFDKVMAEQEALGKDMRAMLEAKGYVSVAAEGFKAPGVIVSYTSDPDLKTGKKFKENGIQIAAGVPLQVDEGNDGEFSTFRIGLFGLDKLHNKDRTIELLEKCLEKF